MYAYSKINYVHNPDRLIYAYTQTLIGSVHENQACGIARPNHKFAQSLIDLLTE